ncbi:hypothetical protein [Thermobacillus sp. ZCTH02-B1]|uniref:hypothetical protein n=1 Tax=Thermobacillus sp. ZCTH02-B1 TaxID=1858795 RepID=UPI0025E041A4|nr:hypothetical protein [Thermobacillus sp. ZCTH02-B1]
MSSMRWSLMLAALLLAAGCSNMQSSGPAGQGSDVPAGSHAPGAAEPAGASSGTRTGSPQEPGTSADALTASPSASGNAGREGDEAAASAVLSIYDTETGERVTVPAPASDVVQLAHDRTANRHAVAFLVEDGFRLYFPDEDRWQHVPLAIRQTVATGGGEKEGALLTPRDEAAGFMLPLRLSPLFAGDRWFYLSRDTEIFRLDAGTGVAERIWAPSGDREGRAIYGMSASPDGGRLAVLVTRDGLGPDTDLLVVDPAGGSVVFERQKAAAVNKSDGFLAHMYIEWLDDRTLGFESRVRIFPEGTDGERRTDGRWGWFTLEMDGTSPEFRTVPESRRFRYASDMSRLAIETEDHEVILLEDSRAGTAVDDMDAVDGRTLPDGEPSPSDGTRLGTGILLGWMDDRYVVWYQNETNLLLEDRFY